MAIKKVSKKEGKAIVKTSDVNVTSGPLELEAATEDILKFARANLKRDIHTEGINSGEYKIKYENVDQYILSMLKASQEMYSSVSFMKNIVDMLGDFSANGIEFVHKSNSIQRFYDMWSQKVSSTSRTNTFLTEFYKTSNVIIYRVLGDMDTIIQGSKRQVQIPIGYRSINPRAVDIEGDDILGNREYYLKNASLKGSSYSRKYASNESTDKEFARYLGSKVDKDGRKKIETEKVFIMQYKKSDWNRWAIPMIYPSIHDVNFKLKLREMDKAAMDSVINVITLFKIGSDEFPATRKLFKKLAAVISGSSPSLNVMWDNNLEVENIHLPVKDILGSEKYESVNADILSGLGVPEILVNGDGSNFSNSFLQVKTVAEKIKTGQENAIEFWTKETRYVADTLGFRTYPEVRIDTISLRDEAQEKKLIKDMLDRGALSMETSLKHIGENIDVEVERIKRENKLEEDGTITKRGPFKRDDDALGEPGSGRPLGDTKKQEIERETKPTGMDIANRLENAPEELNKLVSDTIKNSIAEYKEKTGKAPGPVAVKGIEDKAWASCVSSLMTEFAEMSGDQK